MNLVKGEKYTITVRREGVYTFTYIDTIVDSDGDTMFVFEDDEQDIIEINKFEIGSVLLQK